MPRTLLRLTLAIAIALGAGACSRWDYGYTPYTGPGCLIHLFTRPNLQGPGIPVVKDTPELAEAWQGLGSAKVFYGTWRLYTDRDYKGFMGDYTAPADIGVLLPPGHVGSLQCIKPEPAPRVAAY